VTVGRECELLLLFNFFSVKLKLDRELYFIICVAFSNGMEMKMQSGGEGV